MHLRNPMWSSPLLVTIVAILALVGCVEGGPEESDEPPPPPQLSADDIARIVIGELELEVPLPARGSKMPPEASTSFLNAVRAANVKHKSNPDGERAMRIVSQKLDARIRELEANYLWEHVLTYAQAHVILNLGSRKFQHSVDMAKRELTKPIITITGFYTDGNTNQTAAFLDFYLPLEKITHQHRVRIGEEFYGLRLVDIIGNNQGVTMEYMETDQTFDILMSSAQK